LIGVSRELAADQEELANLFLLPQQEADWLRCRIRPKWERLLEAVEADQEQREDVERLMVHLAEAIWLVIDEGLANKMDHLPEAIRTLWPQLAYTQFTAKNSVLLKDVVALLENPQLRIRQKQQLKRVLASLKALVEIISKIEAQTNRMISTLKNGGPASESSAAEGLEEMRAASRL
jgi:hypothetical protein